MIARQLLKQGGLHGSPGIAECGGRNLQQQGAPIRTQNPEIGARLGPDTQPLPPVCSSSDRRLSSRCTLRHSGEVLATGRHVGSIRAMALFLMLVGTVNTAAKQVTQQLNCGLKLRLGRLRPEHVPAADDDQLRARPGDGYVEPSGWKKNSASPAAKAGLDVVSETMIRSRS